MATYYFNWIASTDATSGVSHYRVFRDNIFQAQVNVPTVSYSVGTVFPTGCWSVSAVDYAGNESAKATCVSPDSTAPSSVVTLSYGTVTTTSIAFSWTAATDNIAVAGYKLYLANGTTVVAITTGTGLSYTLTGLSPNTTDGYKIKAYDAMGNESASFSNMVTVTTLTPPDTTPPSNVATLTVGVITSTSIAMSWTAATDNVAIAGYNIYNSAGTLLVSLGNVLTHTFTGLSSSTAYSYKVKARDTATPTQNLSVSFSNTITPTTLAPSTTPFLEYKIQNDYGAWFYCAAIAGATSYKIYKSVTASPTAGTFTLFSTVTTVLSPQPTGETGKYGLIYYDEGIDAYVHIRMTAVVGGVESAPSNSLWRYDAPL